MKDTESVTRCKRCGDWIKADAEGGLCAYCGRRKKGNLVQVFVYGTLKVGWGNHRCVDGLVERVTPGTVRDYMLFDGGFPCAWPAEGRLVRGEMLTLRRPADALKRLDRLEGTPTHYKRLRVEVECDNGETTHAWMYVYARNPNGGWWQPFTADRDAEGWLGQGVRAEPEPEQPDEQEWGRYCAANDHDEMQANGELPW